MAVKRNRIPLPLHSSVLHHGRALTPRWMKISVAGQTDRRQRVGEEAVDATLRRTKAGRR